MSWLTKLLEALDGLKTYILIAAGVVLWLGMVFEWWSWEEVDYLFGLLGLLGIGSFRSALKKMQ